MVEVSFNAPSAVCNKEMESLAFLIAAFKPLICDVMVSLNREASCIVRSAIDTLAGRQAFHDMLLDPAILVQKHWKPSRLSHWC
jgi:hypothetical protein